MGVFTFASGALGRSGLGVDGLSEECKLQEQGEVTGLTEGHMRRCLHLGIGIMTGTCGFFGSIEHAGSMQRQVQDRGFIIVLFGRGPGIRNR